MDIAQLSKQLQKAHVALLSNDETRFYASAIMIGKSEISGLIPTACTDGVNKYYGYDFCKKLSLEQLIGLVLHENLHCVLKHTMRFNEIYERDAQTIGAATDYVVNDIIHNVKGYGGWIQLPPGGLWDAKFHGWSVSEVYNFLKQGKRPDGEQEELERDIGNNPTEGDEGDEGDEGGAPNEGGAPKQSVTIGGRTYSIAEMDEHVIVDRTPEQQEKIEQELSEAVQQAVALAGVLGKDMPRAIIDAAKPSVDWKQELSQFFSEFVRGTEEYSWRRYDRRRMADDQLAPTRYDERIKELALCVDASGSMYGDLFNRACSAVVDAIEQVDPEVVRVLFWDTDICSDQEFRDNYAGVRAALKPRGGGGTRAACVVEHMQAKGYDPTCVVMITDGYLENDLTWETHIPTLWLVLENERFAPPRGRLVRVA